MILLRMDQLTQLINTSPTTKIPISVTMHINSVFLDKVQVCLILQPPNRHHDQSHYFFQVCQGWATVHLLLSAHRDGKVCAHAALFPTGSPHDN